MTARMLFVSLVALSIAATVPAADQVSPEERQGEPPRTEGSDSDFGLGITVIRLKWANAEELAATLAPILPEGVKVVAYPPLNALIITRDPARSQSPRR